jgi:hypothetical protein
MTRSGKKSGSMVPMLTLLLVAVVAAVVVLNSGVFKGTQEPTTPVPQTGSGIQQTFDNSQTVTVRLSITDCAKPATAPAINTQWMLKDKATGKWTNYETDSASASPSIAISPTTEWKALSWNDTTHYGKVVTGVAPYQALDPIAVCVNAIDATPVLSFFRADDGLKMSATNTEPVTSANQTIDLIQYRVTVADYTSYNKPALCFDYNTVNMSDLYVRNANSASIAKFLTGTAEGCWDIAVPTPGVPVTGYIYAKMQNFASTSSSNVSVYLIDRQFYQNTNTNEFEENFNVNDATTNVGDSTDGSAAATMYFARA